MTWYSKSVLTDEDMLTIDSWYATDEVTEEQTEETPTVEEGE